MVASGDIILPDDDNALKPPREIKRRHLVMIEKVGNGAFGEVWKALLDEGARTGTPEYMVAAKTVIDAANNAEGSAELVAEAAVMMQVIGHPNLVSIIGVITTGDPLVLVLQLCEHGSVLSYLKKQFANGEEVELGSKMVMASEIAAGMEHLASKHFIHRDLAARNVLLSVGREKSVVCKVADFGLSRGANNETNENEDYYKSSSGVFPVRWTSPEAMETLKFSPQSDVWSFGIVVVELFQNGESPYPGMSNPDVMKMTMSGGRHPNPAGCPEMVYKLLLKCWATDVAARPSFRILKATFHAIAELNPRQLPTRHLSSLEMQEQGFVTAGNDYSDGFGFDDDGGLPAKSLDGATGAGAGAGAGDGAGDGDGDGYLWTEEHRRGSMVF